MSESQPAKQQLRSRASMWGITLNNPTPAELEKMRYPNLPNFVISIKHQQEIGESGTLHVQCALKTTSRDFTTIKKYLPRAFIEIARNQDALNNYVQKIETAVPGTQYEWPVGPTNDIVEPTPAEGAYIPPRVECIQVLKCIARSSPFLTIEEQANLNLFDDYKRFKYFVNHAIREVPDLINLVTSANLFSNFKLLFETILLFISEEILDDEDESQPANYTECMID